MTHAIIQARMNSERLPGKVARSIGTMSLLQHVVERARCANVDRVTVAVPGDWQKPRWTDGWLGAGEWCAWGPEEDVLGRIVYAAREAGPDDIIVRLTADCPFVPVAGIAKVAAYVGGFDVDYVKTRSDPSPRPNGIDAQAVRAKVLRRADREVGDAVAREHVTPALEHATRWLGPSPPWETRRYIVGKIEGLLLDTLPSWRLTVDTPEDLRAMGALAAYVPTTPPHPTLRELADLFARHPHLARYE